MTLALPTAPPVDPAPAPPAGELRLDAETMSGLVDRFLAGTDVRPWHRFHSFNWNDIDPLRLTREQKAAVVFITFIEDHLPGYFLENQRYYPVDPSLDQEAFIHNRELYRFSVRWAQEEDAHAHVLFTYQTKSGMATPEALRRALAVEGKKPFRLSFREPMQSFAYALLQEKATQIFYQHLAHAVDEPVLASILSHLARDEARHYAFHASVVEAYLDRYGARIVPLLCDVVTHFQMPLAGTLKNYGLFMRRIDAAVGGFDSRAFFDDLLRIVRRSPLTDSDCAELSSTLERNPAP